MVKDRGSCLSSSERPCPPLASLSLASTYLKPSSRPSPLFALLKRPPFVHTEAANMDPHSPSPSFPSPSLLEEEAYSLHPLKEESSTEGDVLGMASRRLYPNKGAEPDEDSDINGLEEDPHVAMCGRQRLQQHRMQMSGKVVIPDTWGREQQLQDWVSYGIVEDALRPAGLTSARTALIMECERRGSRSKPVRTPPAMSADVEVS